MNEKEIKHNKKAGIPEALHPEIGNGSSFAQNKHDFILLTPDPTKALEHFLPDPESLARVATDAPSKTDAHLKQDSLSAEPELPPTERTTDKVPEDSTSSLSAQKTKTSQVPESPKEASEKAMPKTSSSKPPRISKSKKVTGKKSAKTNDDPKVLPQEPGKAAEPKKAPKPGKRILKAAKAVKKQQEAKKTAAGKKIALKTPVKKVPAKKVPAKKVPLKKSEPPAPIEKKVVAKKRTGREKFHLSPFTQWLKELGGADYVHPYDDDFALNQEKGELNEVISETYANLLAAQGYKERAIEMYLRLIEKYPEKSSFFAAKIQALQ